MKKGWAWVKHETRARKDFFVQELFAEFGHAGYAMWFMLIEIMAENQPRPPTGIITIPLDVLRRELRVSAKKSLDFLNFCSARNKLFFGKKNILFGKINILFENTNQELQIEMPNLLKIKDEYARKSGHCQDNVAQEKEEEKEKEKEEDKERSLSHKLIKRVYKGSEKEMLPVPDNLPVSAEPQPARLPAKKILSDVEWMEKIRCNPAYTAIDIDRELGRMDAWLSTPKGNGRKMSRQFIVNWLNKIDRPIESGQPKTNAERYWASRKPTGDETAIDVEVQR